MLKCSLDKIQLLFAKISENAKLYLPVDNKDGSASYGEWSEGVVRVWPNTIANHGVCQDCHCVGYGATDERVCLLYFVIPKSCEGGVVD